MVAPCCRRTRRRVERYNAVVTQRADKWQAQRSSLSQNPAYSPTCSFSFLFVSEGFADYLQSQICAKIRFLIFFSALNLRVKTIYTRWRK